MGAPLTLPQAGSCPACPTCVSSSYLASFSLHSTKSNYSKGTLQILQKYLCIFLIFGIFLSPLYKVQSLSNVLQKYLTSSHLASLSLHSILLPQILVFLIFGISHFSTDSSEATFHSELILWRFSSKAGSASESNEAARLEVVWVIFVGPGLC